MTHENNHYGHLMRWGDSNDTFIGKQVVAFTSLVFC